MPIRFQPLRFGTKIPRLNVLMVLRRYGLKPILNRW